MMSHPRFEAEFDNGSQTRRWRWFVYWAIIAAASGLLLARLGHAKALQSANDRSRWCTVWSLVERGTYQIDGIIQHPGWDTIDKVRHQGHFFSTKPALLPTIVAGLYWSVKQATGWDLLNETHQTARLILLILNGLPMVIGLVVIASLGERYARHVWTRIYLLIAAGMATLITSFLVTLNNHTIAALSALFALYPALRILADEERRPLWFALAGFFAAFTCTNELPAALFGLTLFGLLVVRAPRATLAYFVPAALIPLVAFFATNYLATGGWKPFYLYYGTEKYLFEYQGVPSYWMRPQGLDQNLDSPLVYFLHCTIGHHGILSLSPIFLLTLAAWVRIRRWNRTPLQPFHWLAMVLTVAILGFYLTRTSNYNYGGTSAGLRWMIWLIPFWLISMIPVLDAWGDRRSFRILAVLLLGVSTFSASAPLANPWQHPWLFRLMQHWNWIDYTQEPPPFDRPVHSWLTELPGTTGSRHQPWIELAGPNFDGTMMRLRLTLLERRPFQGTTLCKLESRWSAGADEQRRRIYHIAEEPLEAGRPPAEFLRWPEKQPSASQRQSAIRFFRGLPKARPYQEGLIRYLHTSARHEAFRCQRAASRVLHRPEDSDERFWYRTDLWLCKQVPFGIAQVKTTIRQTETQTILARRVLTLVDSSTFEDSGEESDNPSPTSTR